MLLEVAVGVSVGVALGVAVRVGEGGIGVAVGDGATGSAAHCACQLNWDEPADGVPPLAFASSAKHEPPEIEIGVDGNTQLFSPTAMAHRLGVSAYVRSTQDCVALGMLVLTRRPTSYWPEPVTALSRVKLPAHAFRPAGGANQ